MSEPAKPTITYDDFAKLDLRVATIRQCEPHPTADKLFKIQLDDGSPDGRQVCAGIRAWYKPEDLVGKQVVIVANLEPRRLRGEISQGMILAASEIRQTGADGQVVERDVVILTVGRAVPAGSPVS